MGLADIYKQLDARLGGLLPGGVTPQQASEEKAYRDEQKKMFDNVVKQSIAKDYPGAVQTGPNTWKQPSTTVNLNYSSGYPPAPQRTQTVNVTAIPSQVNNMSRAVTPTPNPFGNIPNNALTQAIAQNQSIQNQNISFQTQTQNAFTQSGRGTVMNTPSPLIKPPVLTTPTTNNNQLQDQTKVTTHWGPMMPGDGSVPVPLLSVGGAFGMPGWGYHADKTIISAPDFLEQIKNNPNVKPVDIHAGDFPLQDKLATLVSPLKFFSALNTPAPIDTIKSLFLNQKSIAEQRADVRAYNKDVIPVNLNNINNPPPGFILVQPNSTSNTLTSPAYVRIGSTQISPNPKVDSWLDLKKHAELLTGKETTEAYAPYYTKLVDKMTNIDAEAKTQIDKVVANQNELANKITLLNTNYEIYGPMLGEKGYQSYITKYNELNNQIISNNNLVDRVIKERDANIQPLMAREEYKWFAENPKGEITTMSEDMYKQNVPLWMKRTVTASGALSEGVFMFTPAKYVLGPSMFLDSAELYGKGYKVQGALGMAGGFLISGGGSLLSKAFNPTFFKTTGLGTGTYKAISEVAVPVNKWLLSPAGQRTQFGIGTALKGAYGVGTVFSNYATTKDLTGSLITGAAALSGIYLGSTGIPKGYSYLKEKWDTRKSAGEVKWVGSARTIESYAKQNLQKQLVEREGAASPSEHAYPHLKQVQVNIQKAIDATPSSHPYLIKEYGSLRNAKIEISKGMWHDLMKNVPKNLVKNVYGNKKVTHGEILADLIAKKTAPGPIMKLGIKPKVVEAIRTHDIGGSNTWESKLLRTGDAVELTRFKGLVKVDPNKMALPDTARLMMSKNFKASPLVEGADIKGTPSVGIIQTTSGDVRSFYGKNRGGGRVYQEVANPFSLGDRGTWNWKGVKQAVVPRFTGSSKSVMAGGLHLKDIRGITFGYKKGQVVGRQWATTPPEVISKVLYNQAGELFPVSKQQAHMKWFTEMQVREYMMPLTIGGKKTGFGGLSTTRVPAYNAIKLSNTKNTATTGFGNQVWGTRKAGGKLVDNTLYVTHVSPGPLDTRLIDPSGLSVSGQGQSIYFGRFGKYQMKYSPFADMTSKVARPRVTLIKVKPSDIRSNPATHENIMNIPGRARPSKTYVGATKYPLQEKKIDVTQVKGETEAQTVGLLVKSGKGVWYKMGGHRVFVEPTVIKTRLGGAPETIVVTGTKPGSGPFKETITADYSGNVKSLKDKIIYSTDKFSKDFKVMQIGKGKAESSSAYLKYFKDAEGKIVIADIQSNVPNKGYGTELVNALRQQYPDKVISAGVIPSAKPFYEKLGFKNTGIGSEMQLPAPKATPPNKITGSSIFNADLTANKNVNPLLPTTYSDGYANTLYSNPLRPVVYSISNIPRETYTPSKSSYLSLKAVEPLGYTPKPEYIPTPTPGPYTPGSSGATVITPYYPPIVTPPSTVIPPTSYNPPPYRPYIITPPSPPPTTNIKIYPKQSLKGKSVKQKPQKGFYVVTMRNKKQFLLTQKPLIKSQALSFGVKYTKGTERATFKLIPTMKTPIQTGIKPITEQEVWKAGYRPPVKGSTYLKGKDIFIQRKPTRMGTRKETRAIQSYKHRGKSIW